MWWTSPVNTHNTNAVPEAQGKAWRAARLSEAEDQDSYWVTHTEPYIPSPIISILCLVLATVCYLSVSERSRTNAVLSVLVVSTTVACEDSLLSLHSGFLGRQHSSLLQEGLESR